MFDPLPVTSRYHGSETTTLETSDGTVVRYLRRRFVPPASRFALLQEHVVSEGERLDNLAAQYLGDPELFYRLCDANSAMDPWALTAEVGRRLRITMPEGLPGPGAIDA